MASVNLTLPNITMDDLEDDAKLQKILSYLYQLNEQLRYELTHIDDENFSKEGISENVFADALNRTIANMRGDVLRLYASAQKMLVELTSKQQDMAERMGRLEMTSEQLDVEFTYMQESQDELLERMGSLELSSEEFVTEFSKLKQDQENLEKNIGRLEVNSEELSAEFTYLQETQDELIERMGSLEVGNAGMEAEFTQLQKNQQTLTESMGRLEADSESLQTEFTYMQESQDELMERVGSLEVGNAGLEAEFAELQKTQDEIAERTGDLELDAAGMRMDFAAMEQTQNGLSERMTSVETEAGALRIEVRNKVTQNDVDESIENISEFHNTAVDIDDSGIGLNTTGSIRASVNGQEELTVDKDGVSADRVVVRGRLEAPNAVLKNENWIIPWRGSIQTSLDATSKWLESQNATLMIPYGTYVEDVTIRGFKGNMLGIMTDDTVIIEGSINIEHCDQVVISGIGNRFILCPSLKNENIINVHDVGYCTLLGLTISGYRDRTNDSDGTVNGIKISASRFKVEDCVIEYTDHAISAVDGSTGVIKNCAGGNSGNNYNDNINAKNGVYVGSGSHVAATGTIPMGSEEHTKAELSTLVLGDIIPTAGGIGEVSPTEFTKSFAISRHCTYIYGNSRIPDGTSTQFSQGRYGTYASGSNMWRTGAMWFASATNELSGKTIISAKLTLRRASGGWSNPVPVYLGYASITESNYASTTAVAFTASGTQYPGASLDRETEGEYDVTDLMTAVKNGYAIAVKEKVASYTGSHSAAYTQFYGKGSAFEPILTVTYR